jgi:hypothetical protein
LPLSGTVSAISTLFDPLVSLRPKS